MKFNCTVTAIEDLREYVNGYRKWERSNEPLGGFGHWSDDKVCIKLGESIATNAEK
jgi:hypothetical protein